MADDADRADQEVEFALQEQIRIARSRQSVLTAKGHCHYCEEPLINSLLFCDKACAEDYQVEKDQLKRMGRQ